MVCVCVKCFILNACLCVCVCECTCVCARVVMFVCVRACVCEKATTNSRYFGLLPHTNPWSGDACFLPSWCVGLNQRGAWRKRIETDCVSVLRGSTPGSGRRVRLPRRRGCCRCVPRGVGWVVWVLGGGWGKKGVVQLCQAGGVSGWCRVQLGWGGVGW